MARKFEKNGNTANVGEWQEKEYLENGWVPVGEKKEEPVEEPKPAKKKAAKKKSVKKDN